MRIFENGKEHPLYNHISMKLNVYILIFPWKSLIFCHWSVMKIGMWPNFCMLYYLEMLSWPSAWHVGIPIANSELAWERLSWHIKNLDTSQSRLDCRGYSCHQKLLGTWHGTTHMMRLMEWWCTLLTTKHENTLTMCILTFLLNQGMRILSCV
jgi:hypothetical protein